MFVTRLVSLAPTVRKRCKNEGKTDQFAFGRLNLGDFVLELLFHLFATSSGVCLKAGGEREAYRLRPRVDYGTAQTTDLGLTCVPASSVRTFAAPALSSSLQECVVDQSSVTKNRRRQMSLQHNRNGDKVATQMVPIAAPAQVDRGGTGHGAK
jgi:hypothetical protein